MVESVRLYVAAPASVKVIQCSPPSWAARIVLAEKHVPAELIELDFARGAHRAPEIVALNPRGTIPILCHGSRVVHETLAILEYLDRAFPEPPLLPRDLDGLAVALTRLHESAALKDAGMALFAYLMRTDPSERTEERLTALVQTFSAELDRWEAKPTGWEFVLGSTFTLPGVIVFTYLATARQLGLELGRWPSLAKLVTRAFERPSVQATRPAWKERRSDLAGYPR